MVRSKILLSFLLASTSQAYAGPEATPFDPVQDFAPQSLKFDDPQGKGFTWDKSLPCGANRATVLVKFDHAYPSSKGMHLPVAKIWLHTGTPGDSSEQWIAAVLKGPTDRYKLNAQAWLEKT